MKNKYQDKLVHLTENEIEDLIKRYYDGEKNEVLIDEYNIDIRSALLVKTFPPKVHLDRLCPFCNITMFSYRESKSSFSKETIFCKECKHELNSSYCPCIRCKGNRLEKERLAKEEKRTLENREREVILDEYRRDKEDSIDISELDIQMKLYLSSLLRASLSEDLKDIKPLSNSSLKLTPITSDNTYERKIIPFLMKKRLIVLSPNTALDSVTIEENKIVRYIPVDGTYRLNISKDEVDIKPELLLYFEDEDIEEINKELLLTLWLEIGLYECLEYLYVQLDEYRLPSEHIGEKTISAIKEVLNHFSISQVFYFIYKAVKDSAAYYQKEGISKKHAVNLIAGNISRTMERAIAQNWDISKYGRDYNYPQSIVSEIFFDRVLKIGNRGFDSVAKNHFYTNKIESIILPMI
ncbi:MAG: Unknown protein [uncultured Sulfurovum sp.]|uniref:Uncharacterized protein n=1 Tax=uncultured Sulfurovum sp. TaxID=269237 RepID=A0A6S6TQV8_9BACT|nr:MAG: Unknown protein [uncultured Sulfurovum sp.]